MASNGTGEPVSAARRAKAEPVRGAPSSLPASAWISPR